jgi:ABC-type multidrug transport system ATPase subunit
MINVVDLVQHYGVRPVLRNVNLTVNRGELVVLLGPNGMGKTTLMAAIANFAACGIARARSVGFEPPESAPRVWRRWRKLRRNMVRWSRD